MTHSVHADYRISKNKFFVFDKIWFSYFLVKVFYLVFAKTVVSRFTSLGDTFRYLNGPQAWRSDWFFSSTVMMDSFGGTSGMLLGKYLGSFPFLILSFLGVYYSVSKMNISRKQLLGLLAMLSLPSFGVWTSIASKEAVSVFFMGIILAAYIDVYHRMPVRNKLLLVLAVYLCLIFKPQYMIGIFALFSFTFVARELSFSVWAKSFLYIVAIGFGFSVLYYFRDLIDSLSKTMPAHFSMDAGSTRDNTIWVDQYDFYRNAAYGMYIAFVGPTLQEALSKPTHMMVWIESMTILPVIFVLCSNYALRVARSSRINVMFLAGFSLLAFWILLVHYPFGALNPGSAIRYRESFYAFLVCLFYFMYRNAMNPTSSSGGRAH